MKSSTEQSVLAYRDAMAEFQQEMETLNTRSKQIWRHTTRVVRLVAALAVLAACGLAFTVYMLGGEMVHLARSMTQMYEQFGAMAVNVDGVRTHVIRIEHRIEGMPLIATNVNRMSAHLTGITQKVARIDQDMERMDGSVRSFRSNLGRMTSQFQGLDNSVHWIRYNTREMARPVP